MRIEKSKSSAFFALVFAFVAFWLFVFAHVFDDVRHGSENLFILFGTPFWITASVASRFAVYGFWCLFPLLAPRHSSLTTSGLPVLFGVLLALAAAIGWRVSPFFILVYGSSKVILLILITGLMLGWIGKVGGRASVLTSLLAGFLSAVTAFLAVLLIMLVWVGSKDLWDNTWTFASLGVPFAVSVTLFQYYQRASAKVKALA